MRWLGRLLAGLAVLCATDAAAGPLPANPIMAYVASWYEPAVTRGAETTLARLPAAIDLVVLGFARPDAIYPAGGELRGSGLQFQYPTGVLRQGIRALKARNPRARVLVAVGGANYRRWDRLDAPALARLVHEIGADGIDLDYEPGQPDCAARDGRVECRTDAAWRDLVRRVRAVLPRPHLLTVPGWSVGAYGEGAWANATPRSPWTGSMLGLLRSPEAAEIDLVSIMAYDAGPAFDPVEAYRAYRHHWAGPLALGFQVMPSAVPGPRATLDTVDRQIAAVRAHDPAAGAMLYALNETPPGAIGRDNPDPPMLVRQICRALGRTGCEQPRR